MATSSTKAPWFAGIAAKGRDGIPGLQFWKGFEDYDGVDFSFDNRADGSQHVESLTGISPSLTTDPKDPWYTSPYDYYIASDEDGQSGSVFISSDPNTGEPWKKFLAVGTMATLGGSPLDGSEGMGPSMLPEGWRILLRSSNGDLTVHLVAGPVPAGLTGDTNIELVFSSPGSFALTLFAFRNQTGTSPRVGTNAISSGRVTDRDPDFVDTFGWGEVTLTTPKAPSGNAHAVALRSTYQIPPLRVYQVGEKLGGDDAVNASVRFAAVLDPGIVPFGGSALVLTNRDASKSYPIDDYPGVLIGGSLSAGTGGPLAGACGIGSTPAFGSEVVLFQVPPGYIITGGDATYYYGLVGLGDRSCIFGWGWYTEPEYDDLKQPPDFLPCLHIVSGPPIILRIFSADNRVFLTDPDTKLLSFGMTCSVSGDTVSDGAMIPVTDNQPYRPDQERAENVRYIWDASNIHVEGWMQWFLVGVNESTAGVDFTWVGYVATLTTIIDWVGWMVGMQHADPSDIRRIVWPQG